MGTQIQKHQCIYIYIYIYGSFPFVFVVQIYDLRHGGNGGVQLPIWDLSGPRGSLALRVGARLAQVGGEQASNTASENSVQKLRAARPGTFIKESRSQARAAGVAHRGDSRFRVGKINWRFAPTKCKIFWALRFGRGRDSENSEKHCVFSHPNLNLKEKSSFQAIVEKTVPGWTGGLKGAGGCSPECCSVVGQVDERLAVEAEGHYI